MKTGFGPNLISLRQSSEGTHSVFSSAWLFNIIVLFVKAIAKMRFAKASFLPKKYQLFVHLLVILTLTLRNIGSSFGPSMVCVVVHDIGMTRLMPFFNQSVLYLL